MTRPDDIPADALEAAKRAAYAVEGTFDDGAITSFNGVRVIARAILTARSEQREEDAQTLEAMADEYDASAIIGNANLVPQNRAAESALKRGAAAIRNGEK